MADKKGVPKIWGGVNLDHRADKFNASINTDKKLWREDIKGSIAHATMLKSTGIISDCDADTIVLTLSTIYKEIDSGKLSIDTTAEDIHSFVEATLIARIGDIGKKLHVARSRNDQTVTDLRLYVAGEIIKIKDALTILMKVLVNKAIENLDAIMPGYTHLQRAQPVLFAQYLLAYFEMFYRDRDRLNDTFKRVNISPLGACALAGTSFPINRTYTAELLKFDTVSRNSVDSVSDRDFVIETIADLAIVMMHISRLSEEIILWNSHEFKFIDLDEKFSTGSSIMPQKRNPDIAELSRGKTGRVYGDLFAILTVMKGLPLSYNKDMQEDKDIIFDAIDTTKACLEVLSPMLEGLRIIKENMLNATEKGFINATDCADYLTSCKGVPFREAYDITKKIVEYCSANGFVLESLPLEIYRTFSTLIDNDIYEAVNMLNCLNHRNSQGGTSKQSVKHQIDVAIELLKT